MKAEDALNMAKSYVRKTAEGLGAVKGKDGKDGISPTIVENANNTDDIYKLDITDKNGSFTTPNLKEKSGGTTDIGSTYYNANNYGVVTGNNDNSSAMQDLMLSIHEKGGGVIFVPNGTYKFKAQMTAYSNVSIWGESIDNTILKVVRDSDDGKEIALFYHHYPENKQALLSNPIKSCFYKNFTVDMSEMTVDTYRTGNKAFYYQNVQDCVFEDLKLIGTPATALGIDCLVNTHINRIYCENCGRTWETGGLYGGAAIGIGTGLLENESFTITNCICKNSGHFGIFVENQYIFHPEIYTGDTESIFISNNKVIGSRGNGIGVRRCNNVTISNNSICNSVENGIYIDQNCEKLNIKGNEVRNSGESGIITRLSENEIYETGTGIVQKDICIDGNVVDGNVLGFSTEGGESETNKTEYLSIKNNIFSRNQKGIKMQKLATHENTIIKNNCFLNNSIMQVDIKKSIFNGTTAHNEPYNNTKTLSYSDLLVGYKIGLDGAEEEQADGAISAIIPVNSTNLEIYVYAPNNSSIALGQYDITKTFLERTSLISLGINADYAGAVQLKEDTKYIKIFVNKVSESASYRITSL